MRTGKTGMKMITAAAVVVMGVLAISGVDAQVAETVPPGGSAVRTGRVAVLPVVNDTALAELDRVAAEMTRTITLLLQTSGRFEVVTVEPFNPYSMQGPARLSEISRSLRLQGVVIGRLTDLDRGRIELESALYGGAEGWIAGGITREAYGAFDVVEAADELVIATASALIGFPVELGGIVLRPSRDDVPYRVYLDGFALGENLAAIPQVPVGRRTIEIALVRTGGDQIIFSADRLIRPGEALEIFFQIPAVTVREQIEIIQRHDLVARLQGDPTRAGLAERTLQESRQLLERTSSESRQQMDQLVRDQEFLEALWQLEKEFLALQFSGTGGAVAPVPVARRHIGAADKPLRERARRNALVHFHLLDLERVRVLDQGLWDEAGQLLDAMADLNRELALRQDAMVQAEQRAWNSARAESDSLRERRSRPWPIVGMAVGAAGMGVGGYFFYDEPAGDAAVVEAIRWGAVGVGAVTVVASALRWRSNRRVADASLSDWTRERFAYPIGVAAELDSYTGEDVRTGVLILGPSGQMISVDGQPRTLPLLMISEAGAYLRVGRAPVVAEEISRPVAPGLNILVVE